MKSSDRRHTRRPLTPLELLTQARALLADPEHWTKGAYARGTKGEPMSPTDNSAVCFCSVGAILRVAGHDEDGAYHHLQRVCIRETSLSLVTMNDTRSHPEVLAVWDIAIKELAEQ